MKRDTYSEVFEAADALLAEGVRPTQQNVRDRLGKGSISTIHKALGDWWQTLGQRLKQGRDYPEIPDLLSEAMITWWHTAVDRSRREFEGQQDQAQRQLKALRAAHRDELEQLQTKLSAALDKLSRQVEQQQLLHQQLHDAGQERLSLEQRVLVAESKRSALELDAKIDAAVITRLEADKDALSARLKAHADPDSIKTLQQENLNLRSLVADLDSQYNKSR